MSVVDRGTCTVWCPPHRGVRRIRWRVDWTDGRQQQGEVHVPAEHAKDEGFAELVAVRDMLHAYQAQGGQGPLQVALPWHCFLLLIGQPLPRHLRRVWQAIDQLADHIPEGVQWEIAGTREREPKRHGEPSVPGAQRAKAAAYGA